MHLEEVELFGFKTFLKTTKIILSREITCVVGPNGSGKSNIVDAIRWVLGEGRLSLLRVSDSSDLIFAGSQLRNPLNIASVKLIFDNEDRKLPVHAPKVIIERRIYREKESRYYLNGEESSLQNILSVFHASGIFGYSFAIVGQGRVDEIVLAKPEEKKQIIDKIAGIDHFKRKKEDALKRLAETDENLTRVYDRLQELRKEAKRVVDEAQKAHLHYLLTDKLKMLEGLILNGSLKKLTQDLEKAKNGLEGLYSEDKELMSSLNEEKKKFEEVNMSLKKVVEQIESLKSNREELSVVKAKNEEKENHLRDKSSMLEVKHQETRSRIENLLHTKDNLAQSLNEIRIKKRSLSEEKAQKLKEKESIDIKIKEINDEIEPLISKEESLKERLTELQESRVMKEKLIGSLEAESKYLNTRRGELLGEIKSLEKIEIINEEEIQEILEKISERKNTILGKLNDLNDKIAQKKYEVSELQKFLHMGEKKETFKEKTLGKFMELDKTFPGIEEELDAIVLDSEDKIPRNKSGHYFLDINVKSYIQRNSLTQISEIIGKESKFLSNVYYAENLSIALEFFRKNYNKFPIKKIITKDGFVVLSPFEVKVNTEIVAREKLTQLKQAEEELETLIKKREELLAELSSTEEEYRANQNALIKSRENRERKSRITELHKELSKTEEDINENLNKIEKIKIELKEILSQASYVKQDEELEKKKKLIDSLKENLNMVLSSIREIDYREESMSREIEEYEKRTNTIEKEMTDLKILLENLEKEISLLKDELNGKIDLLNKLSLDVVEVDRNISKLKEKSKGYEEDLREKEVKIAKITEQRNNLLSRVERLHVITAQKETEMQSLINEMEEKEIQRHDIPYEVDIERTKKEVKDIKAELAELGAIDFTSLEKEENVVSELEEKEKVFNEVKTAKRELEKFIEETERKIKTEFENTLKAVEENFSQLFQKMMHGGEASIERIIDDSGEVKGIEMNVRLPGKRKQPLPLLSGGEKALTALAFLFSIFRVKNFPFYILDEVDASLDDENVIHFGELLKEEAQNAQYIVITHNKQTMEAAEILYGITMEEEGVSKVVSLKLV